MRGGDAEATAEVRYRGAAGQQVTDYTGLGALVDPPEHLGPHLRWEVAAPDVEDQAMMPHPVRRQRADEAAVNTGSLVTIRAIRSFSGEATLEWILVIVVLPVAS
jgi:hypothetical protein